MQPHRRSKDFQFRSTKLSPLCPETTCKLSSAYFTCVYIAADLRKSTWTKRNNAEQIILCKGFNEKQGINKKFIHLLQSQPQKRHAVENLCGGWNSFGNVGNLAGCGLDLWLGGWVPFSPHVFCNRENIRNNLRECHIPVSVIQKRNPSLGIQHVATWVLPGFITFPHDATVPHTVPHCHPYLRFLGQAQWSLSASEDADLTKKPCAPRNKVDCKLIYFKNRNRPHGSSFYVNICPCFGSIQQTNFDRDGVMFWAERFCCDQVDLRRSEFLMRCSVEVINCFLFLMCTSATVAELRKGHLTLCIRHHAHEVRIFSRKFSHCTRHAENSHSLFSFVSGRQLLVWCTFAFRHAPL